MDINNTFHTDHTSHEFARSHSIPPRSQSHHRRSPRYKTWLENPIRSTISSTHETPTTIVVSYLSSTFTKRRGHGTLLVLFTWNTKRQPRSSAFHSCIMPAHHYHIYSGGAIGIDEYAEQCAKECDMHMHVIVPPHHSRSKFITPLRPEDLNEAEPHLKRVAQKTGKHLFTPDTFSRHLQLLLPCTPLVTFKIRSAIKMSMLGLT